MFELKNEFIKDYWFTNKINDCSKTIDSLDEIPVIITESEIEYLNTNNEYLFEDNVKKLNNKDEADETFTFNEYRTKKGPNSRVNKSDISTKNTRHYNQHNSDRQVISNCGMFNNKISNQHSNLFNQSYTNCDKRKMYQLPKTSRVCRFKERKRKILLDS